MSPTKLRFKTITIRSMPGFREGGFIVPELCPGVNVIHGPNASGKTTLARAIEALLWPKEADGSASVSASADFEEDDWSIDVENRRASYRRGGESEAPPPLPAGEARSRYSLALHELLRTEEHNTPLADIVMKESAGGYSLEEARRRLGFERPGALSRKLKPLMDACRTSALELREVRRDQQALQEDEANLQDLRKERDAAREATREAGRIDQALNLVDCREKLESARRAVEAFDARMAKVKGNEPDTLTGLKDRLEKTQAYREEGEKKRDEARKLIEKSKLPEAGVSSGLVGALKEKSRAVLELEGKVEAAQKEWSRENAEAETRRAFSGETISEAKLAVLDHERVSRLADFARRVEKTRGERAFFDKARDLVGEAQAKGDADPWRQGIDCLNSWLRVPVTPGANPVLKVVLLLASAGLVLTGVKLAVYVHLALGLFALGGIAAAIFALALKKDDGGREVFRKEYEGLRLKMPRAWKTEEVTELVRELGKELAALLFEEKKSEFRETLDADRAELDETWAGLQAERRDLVEDLGLAPGVDETALHLLAANLVRWRDAQAKAEGARADLNHHQGALKDLLAEINAALVQYGYEEGKSHADVASCLNDLEARVSSFEEAKKRLDEAAGDLAKRIEPEIQDLTGQVNALFAGLELEAGDERDLGDLVGRHGEFQEARKVEDLAARDFGKAEEVLADKPDLKVLDRQALENLLEENQRLASGLEDFKKKIHGTEALIKKAKQSHAIEDKLSIHETRLEALRREREALSSALLGSRIADLVKERSCDASRPRVFHRAREIFTTITHGRYRLDFDDADSPRFRALDTSTGLVLTLDQLSSGSRVQLLLAGRLAFVETEELGVKLPLLLDETLANSDDFRARAIIEAAAEVARGGRQVFYFTAQADEVGKWRSVIARAEEVEFKSIDLGKLAPFREEEELPAVKVMSPPEDEVPEPAGRTHEEYGAVLNVPRFDPHLRDTRGTDLWYLLEDPDTLYSLRKRRVSFWGALRELRGIAGEDPLEGKEEVFNAIRAKAAALEAFAAAWRQGRGKPLSRRAIMDSDAVSETFQKKIIAVAEAVDWNAEALLEKLEAGEVLRFGKKAEALREDLESRGFLTEEEMALSFEEMRGRALRAAQGDLESGVITVDGVDRMLHRLGIFENRTPGLSGVSGGETE